MRSPLILLSLTLALASAACGGTANVAGTYAVTLVDGKNGCNFSNWTEGHTTMLSVLVTQSGSAVTASATQLSGAFLDIVLGAHTWNGTVSGNDLSLELFGTRAATSAGCTYTVNSLMTGTISGDFMSGTLDYTDATGGGPNCATLTNCHTFQSWNGSRPPTPK